MTLNYLFYTGMARSGCCEGYGSQNPVDRRDVHIRREPRTTKCVWLGRLETVRISEGYCGYSTFNGGDGSPAWAVHQDIVYPSRYVGFSLIQHLLLMFCSLLTHCTIVFSYPF